MWQGGATLAAPALRVLLARRVARGKELAGRLAERRGIDATNRPEGRLIWLHAASLGETLSILPVMDALAAVAPGVTLLLTTGTVTSARIAAERLPAGARHRFVPLDVPRWAARFLDHWRPDAACFVESEIWPSLLEAAARRDIPVALLNGRLSATSYARWRRAPGFARRLFGRLRLIWARSERDAARLGDLAGRAVAAPGDLKFASPALPVEAAALAAARAALGGAPVFVAASVHPGEDAMVAAAHAGLVASVPLLATILVPRHPGRGAEMAAAVGAGLRSSGAVPVAGGLYVADTLGELGLFYRLADCVLVGGSLVPHGGQNPLEPARLGRAIAMGPYTGNFEEACGALTAGGGLARVVDGATLRDWVAEMLGDAAARTRMGDAAAAASRHWEELPAAAAQALLAMMETR